MFQNGQKQNELRNAVNIGKRGLHMEWDIHLLQLGHY